MSYGEMGDEIGLFLSRDRISEEVIKVFEIDEDRIISHHSSACTCVSSAKAALFEEEYSSVHRSIPQWNRAGVRVNVSVSSLIDN